MTYVMAQGPPSFPAEREQPSSRFGVHSLVLSMPKNTTATWPFPHAFFSLMPARTNATNNIYTGRSRPDRLLHRKADEKKAARSAWDMTRPRRTCFYGTHLNEESSLSEEKIEYRRRMRISLNACCVCACACRSASSPAHVAFN